MEVRCEKCQARYRVDDARVGPRGLTMRCGKCQNTFRVSRNGPGGEAVAAAPGLVAASAAPPDPVLPPAIAEPPSSTPAAAPIAPSRAQLSATPARDEGVARTMIFQSSSLTPVPSPRTAAPPPPAAASPTLPEGSSATVMFERPRAVPTPKPPPSKAASESPAQPPPTLIAPPTELPSPPTVPDLSGAEPQATRPRAGPPPPPPPEPPDAVDPERIALDGPERIALDGAEGAEPLPPEPRATAFDRAPPKAVLIGVAAGVVAVLIAGAALFAVRKFRTRPPSEAAIQALADARIAAEKDTLASIADAESRVRDAIDLAGTRARFPEGPATLGEVQVQWADALNDQALFLVQKAARAAERGEGPRRAEAEAQAGQAQQQAKAKLKSALDLVLPAAKANPKSPSLQLALADCYRAQRSTSLMNRELRRAQALKADESGVALVQGLAWAQDEDNAARAIPRLQAALKASPSSARIHFRMAMAWLALRDDANARKELQETLRLAPQHERARTALDLLALASAPQHK